MNKMFARALPARNRAATARPSQAAIAVMLTMEKALSGNVISLSAACAAGLLWGLTFELSGGLPFSRSPLRQAFSDRGLGVAHRLMCIAPGPKTVAVGVEVRLPVLLHHLCDGLLDQSVRHRRYAKKSLPAVWLGNSHAFEWIGLIRPRYQLLADAGPVHFKPLLNFEWVDERQFRRVAGVKGGRSPAQRTLDASHLLVRWPLWPMRHAAASAIRSRSGSYA